MTIKKGEQLRLFDIRSIPEADPGDMRPDAWLARSDVVFHGTLEGDYHRWHHFHAGTWQAANDRIYHRSFRTVSPDDATSNDPTRLQRARASHSEKFAQGDIFPYRIRRNSRRAPIRDSAANLIAEAANRAPEFGGTVPPNVPRVLHSDVEYVMNGGSIGYKNEFEDPGSTSYVVGRGRTWRDDVMRSPRGRERYGAYAEKYGDLVLKPEQFSETESRK